MVGIILAIVALCGLAQPQDLNEWSEVKNPLDSTKNLEMYSKLFPNSSNVDKFLSRLITGGKEATLGQFPYQALLILRNHQNAFLCGGIIISNNWILTAAHCLEEMTSAEVFVGTIICSPLKFVWKLKVEKGDLIAHEDYDSYSNINDIGLIRLASEIPQHSSVNYISLPIRDEAKNYLIGKTATTIGFGKYSDTENSLVLRYIEVTIIEEDVCEETFGPFVFYESNICVGTAGGKSACQGDSGGPLTVLRSDGTPELAGVTSYGSAAGCTKNHPVVYTRVHSFLDWIQTKSGIQIS